MSQNLKNENISSTYNNDVFTELLNKPKTKSMTTMCSRCGAYGNVCEPVEVEDDGIPKKISKKELRDQFADFLETQVLEENWDFGTILLHYDFDYKDFNLDKKTCGTIGCAIGHLPFLEQAQKDGWTFKKIYNMSINNTCVSEYLGLTYEAFQNIFFKTKTYKRHYDEITPQMVAAELRKYSCSMNVNYNE